MHRHVWKIKGTVTHQSPWEQMNTGVKVTHAERVAPYFYERPVIVTYQCEVCGEEKVERV